MRTYTALGTLVLVLISTFVIMRFNYHSINTYGKNETKLSGMANNTISQATKNFWQVLVHGESSSAGSSNNENIQIIEIDGVLTGKKCKIDKAVLEVPSTIDLDNIYVGPEDGSEKIDDCKKIAEENTGTTKIECDGEISDLEPNSNICVFISGEKKACVALGGSDGCSYSQG